MQLGQYLKAGVYTDSNHLDVIAYAQKHAQGITKPKEQAIALYYAIRDGFRYDPYHLLLKPYALKASYLLTKDYGYCIEKSNLYAATLRVLGIPSRLSYSNVRNHLSTGSMEEELGSDVLVFHGVAEVYLEDKWIKTTPVFNKELCEKYGVAPLDFDGENDSVFQASDKEGNPFMEYIHDYGIFADVPFLLFKKTLQEYYPHLFKRQFKTDKFTIEF